MEESFTQVWTLAERERITLRLAAWMFAVGRVVQAMAARGVAP
jgi:glutamate dehydrogenase/leucine dehydrogenase